MKKIGLITVFALFIGTVAWSFSGWSQDGWTGVPEQGLRSEHCANLPPDWGDGSLTVPRVPTGHKSGTARFPTVSAIDPVRQTRGSKLYAEDEKQLSGTITVTDPANMQTSVSGGTTNMLGLDSDAIESRQWSEPLWLTPIGNQAVLEGWPLVLTLTASGGQDENYTYSASNLPPGAEFFPDSALFMWTPSFTEAETTYSGVHFEVWNQSGESDWEEISIQVVYAPVGDCNDNGMVELGDVVWLLNYLFKAGPPPNPLETGDVNLGGIVELGDVIVLLNYLFMGHPLPGAKVSPLIVAPRSGTVVNGQMYVAVENMRTESAFDTVWLEYSIDSLTWFPITEGEEEPSRENDPFSASHQTFWDTEGIPSGPCWLRAIMNHDYTYGIDTAQTRLTVNRPPIDSVTAVYDSLTHMATIDGSSSTDPDPGDSVVSWTWYLPGDTLHGDTMATQVDPGDSIYVVLEVADRKGNKKLKYFWLVILNNGTWFLLPVNWCICESVGVKWSGDIPRGSDLSWAIGQLYNKPKADGSGFEPKKLGVTKKVIRPKRVKMGSAVYFMVEGKVTGDPSKCTFGQDVKKTFTHDGEEGSPEATYKTVGGVNFPYAGENLGNDDYRTRSNVKGQSVEVKPGNPISYIRWLDAPGPRWTGWDKGYEPWDPNGMEWKAYFESWINGSAGQQSCKCKFEFGLKYDKDGKPKAGGISTTGDPELKHKAGCNPAPCPRAPEE